MNPIQNVLDEYRTEMFFSMVATPAESKELARNAPLNRVVELRDSIDILVRTKIRGNETQVGNVLATRFEGVRDKLTELIDERTP